MARIPYPDPEHLTPEIRDRLVRLGSLNVTRMMSHAPGVMVAYSKLGSELLLRGNLDAVLREVVILRIGQLCRSDYEWHQHESVARAVGMPEEMLAAIARQEFAALPAREQLVVRVAEEIHGQGVVAAGTFAEAREQFAPAELVELTILAGFYMLTAGFLRSFDVEIEEGAPLGASIRQ